ncbi:TenA family transcriptional regulator [Archangium gephyra]|uniref:TenA family transcriptional regulator n=1 Tax=Archangium gephyra TaxID=48 RepID=UPI003B777563
MSQSITRELLENSLRNDLVKHPFFEAVKKEPLSKEQVAIFLSQWWHPLHYFPTFLSRLISVTPKLEDKTAISKILWQELGEGDVERAHERIYISTMVDVGFAREQFVDVEPFPATAKLIERYAVASGEALQGLGFLYGTEVADYPMVSGIGRAVKRVTGVKELPWVTIHALQEPEHVRSANATLKSGKAEKKGKATEDSAAVVRGAEEMWTLWIAFFSALEQAMFREAAPQAAKVARKVRAAG